MSKLDRTRRTHLGGCVGLLVGLLALCMALRGNCKELFWLDATRMDTLLAAAGLQHSYPGVLRDQAGTRLYLITTTNRDTVVMVFSEQGSQLKLLPGLPAAITDDGLPICSVSDRTLVFATGQRIPLAPGGKSRWGFCPGGTLFFFLREFPAEAGIFLAAEPVTAVANLPQYFLPQRIFTSTNEYFVFGIKYESDKEPGKLTELVFSRRKPAPKPEREIDLSRFGGVVDMDTDRGLLLVVGKREMFNTWGVYNLETRKYKSLGSEKAYGFFLTPGLVQYLEKRCEAKAPATK